MKASGEMLLADNMGSDEEVNYGTVRPTRGRSPINPSQKSKFRTLETDSGRKRKLLIGVEGKANLID